MKKNVRFNHKDMGRAAQFEHPAAVDTSAPCPVPAQCAAGFGFAPHRRQRCESHAEMHQGSWDHQITNLGEMVTSLKSQAPTVYGFNRFTPIYNPDDEDPFPPGRTDAQVLHHDLQSNALQFSHRQRGQISRNVLVLSAVEYST